MAFLNHSIESVLSTKFVANPETSPATSQTTIESPLSSPCLSEDENMPRPAHQTSRRGRTAFSRDQVAKLEREFAKENYISKSRRLELAAKIKLPESTIKIWFQNRRMKYKHQRIEKMWPFSGYFMPPMMMMDPMASQTLLMTAPPPTAAMHIPASAAAGPAPMMLPYNYPPSPPATAYPMSYHHSPYPMMMNSGIYGDHGFNGCGQLSLCC